MGSTFDSIAWQSSDSEGADTDVEEGAQQGEGAERQEGGELSGPGDKTGSGGEPPPLEEIKISPPATPSSPPSPAPDSSIKTGPTTGLAPGMTKADPAPAPAPLDSAAATTTTTASASASASASAPRHPPTAPIPIRNLRSVAMTRAKKIKVNPPRPAPKREQVVAKGTGESKCAWDSVKIGARDEDEQWLEILGVKEMEQVPEMEPLEVDRAEQDKKAKEKEEKKKPWAQIKARVNEQVKEHVLASVALLEEEKAAALGVSLCMFVVFHKRLETSMYSDLSRGNVQFLHFFKVNDKIPYELGLKHFPGQPPFSVNITKENSLKVFNPWLQEKGFNELSCILHVYCNNLHLEHEYVGVCQYDMKISDSHIQTWCDWIRSGRRSSLFSSYSSSSSQPSNSSDMLALPEGAIAFSSFLQTYVEETPWLGFPMEFVLYDLCGFFKITLHSLLQTIRDRIQYNALLPLYNTFLLRRDLFVKLASWLLHLYPLLYRYTEAHQTHKKHHGHYGGIIERCIGIFLLWQHHSVSSLPIPHIGLLNSAIPEIHRTKFGQK